MDVRDEITWCYKHEYADEQGGYIQCQNEEPVKLYWDVTYVVSLRIKLHDACQILNGQQSQTDDVAQ